MPPTPAQRRLSRLRAQRAAGGGPRPIREPELELEALVGAGGFTSRSELLRHLSKANGAGYRAGGLTIWQADAAATACGFHPAEVWGSAWWEAVARHEARYALERVEVEAELEELEAGLDELERELEELER